MGPRGFSLFYYCISTPDILENVGKFIIASFTTWSDHVPLHLQFHDYNITDVSTTDFPTDVQTCAISHWQTWRQNEWAVVEIENKYINMLVLSFHPLLWWPFSHASRQWPVQSKIATPVWSHWEVQLQSWCFSFAVVFSVLTTHFNWYLNRSTLLAN